MDNVESINVKCRYFGVLMHFFFFGLFIKVKFFNFIIQIWTSLFLKYDNTCLYVGYKVIIKIDR